MWSATQIPHILRTTLVLVTGIPEAKLRIIAPDVGGGFGSKLNVYAEEALCLALARKLGRPIKWIEGRSEALRRNDPRPRRRPGDRARGDRGREDHRGAGAADGCDGRLPPARHAGHPDPRRLALRRLLRRPGLRLRVRGRLHEHDADRRLPRRRPARGDLRDRARGRRARAEARHGPGRAAPEELHHGVPGDDRVRARRSTRATTRRRSTRRSSSSTTTALRAEQAERRERGDTKQLGIGFSTYVEMCGLAPSRILGAIRYGAGGWDAADDPLPPDRHRPGDRSAPHRTGRAT